MKRLVLLVSGFLLAFSAFSAPVHGGAGGGFKAGLNIASIHGDDADDWDSKTGFCAGGFVNYSVAGMIAIQPEVLYTTKGAEYDAKIFTETWHSTVSMNYIEIPFLFKVVMPLPGLIKPTIFAGPYGAIKMSATFKSTFGDLSDEGDIDDVKATDFGLVFGGGLDFWAPLGKLMLDARYSQGLTTIDESDSEDDVKNGVFSLSLGYCFQP